MRFLRRARPSWPAELERRKPQNADFRQQLERAHRQRAQLQAAEAIALTDENQNRINLLDAAVRALKERTQ